MTREHHQAEAATLPLVGWLLLVLVPLVVACGQRKPLDEHGTENPSETADNIEDEAASDTTMTLAERIRWYAERGGTAAVVRDGEAVTLSIDDPDSPADGASIHASAPFVLDPGDSPALATILPVADLGLAPPLRRSAGPVVRFALSDTEETRFIDPVSDLWLRLPYEPDARRAAMGPIRLFRQEHLPIAHLASYAGPTTAGQGLFHLLYDGEDAMELTALVSDARPNSGRHPGGRQTDCRGSTSGSFATELTSSFAAVTGGIRVLGIEMHRYYVEVSGSAPYFDMSETTTTEPPSPTLLLEAVGTSDNGYLGATASTGTAGEDRFAALLGAFDDGGDLQPFVADDAPPGPAAGCLPLPASPFETEGSYPIAVSRDGAVDRLELEISSETITVSPVAASFTVTAGTTALRHRPGSFVLFCWTRADRQWLCPMFRTRMLAEVPTLAPHAYPDTGILPHRKKLPGHDPQRPAETFTAEPGDFATVADLAADFAATYDGVTIDLRSWLGERVRADGG